MRTKRGLVEQEVGLWILAAIVLLILIIIIGLTKGKMLEWISKLKDALRYGA